jgi:hypothetical protein
MTRRSPTDRPSRGRLYATGLGIVVAGIVMTASSALYITAGGNLFGMGAGTFGIGTGRPDDGAATLQRARQAAWSGRHLESIAAYDTVLALRPDDRELALERARVLGWAERYDLAADALAALPPPPRDTSPVEHEIQRARYLWWAGRAREADSLLSVIRAAHPEVQEAAELQAMVRPAVEPALAVAERWVAERPEDPRSNLWLARALVGEGRSSESLRHYRLALGEPGSVEPQVLLEAAGVALGVDSLGFAGQLLARYLNDVDPPDHETRLRLARAYSWSARYAAAEEQYRLVLEQAPTDDVRRELTDVLVRAGRYDEVAAELATMLAARETVELLRELARVRALAERYGDAADALARVLAARPGDHAARLERARFLWWAGRLREADEEISTLLAVAPGYASAMALRAQVRPSIEPDVELARAWVAEQESPENRLHLARALVRAGRLAEALDHYDLALGDGADGELVIEAVDVADAAGSPDRVLALLERHVTAVARPAPSVRLRLARALAWADRPADAARVYGDYLAERPEHVAARLERARQLAWSDTTAWGEARAELERVVAAEPGRAEAVKLLGDLARWSGDPETALAHYRRAQSLDPGLESLEEGVRLALELRAAGTTLRDATQVAWAAEMDAFTDSEGFDWVGSGVRREWRSGESALGVRLTQGYSRGRPVTGPGLGSLGLGATVAGRMALAPGWGILAELGAISYDDVDAFVTWGAGIEFADALSLARLRYGRSPAVREAATMAALQAGATLDRVHVEGSRYFGPWRVATDLQFQRFQADAGDADRYAGMLVVDRAVGGTGIAIGPMVRAIGSPHGALEDPGLAGWGRLYWTPDYYLAPALSLRYGGHIADGLWLGLRAAPGIAFIDEGEGDVGRYDSDRTAILEAGATLGYRRGDWSLELSGDWGGALPDGYNASALRIQLSRFGGPR